MLDVILLITYLYTSICYKYFVLGFILFMVMIMAAFMALDNSAFMGFADTIAALGLPVIALFGYIAIFIGGALDRRATLQEAFVRIRIQGIFP